MLELFGEVGGDDPEYFSSAGLSHTFLGMGPGPLELGKLSSFGLKLGKSILSICMKFPLLD